MPGDEEDVKKSREGPELNDSSDSENDSLQIALEDEVTPKRKKRRSSESHFDARKLDKTIEETIEKCQNITPDVAKKMLMKLIKNEHVLALSLLKAEEEEKKEQTRSSESDDDDKKSESDMPSTPKLTRLKAKQLNHQLPMPGSLKTTEPCEDVVALINEDMRSDDEDDEYQPHENECFSDEDVTNTTFSDIDSQPSTPGSALLYSEQDFESPNKHGDFKVPRTRTLSIEEQENISRRTRSKLCLSTTPIETIESTFVPPDITTDMYDFEQDHEIDNEWKEFLNEFMMPLTNAEEDDEKSDPEYVVSESVPVDKEELRPVRVSKKELNQLISELLEDSCNLNFDSDQPSTSSKRSSFDSQTSRVKKPRHSSPTNVKMQSPKVQSKVVPKDILETPPRIILTPSSAVETPQKAKQVEVVDSPMSNPFYQQQLMTPQRMGFCTPTLMQSPAMFASPYSTQVQTPEVVSPQVSSPMVAPTPTSNLQITGVYGAVSTQAPPILVLNAHNQLELHSPLTLMNQAFCSNGTMQLPQFQSIVVQVPTIDLLQNNFNVCVTQKSQEMIPNVAEVPPVLEIDEPTVVTKEKKKPGHKNEKLDVFQYLETEDPPDDSLLDTESRGFTVEQKNIFEQQLRMHAQLLSQHYLQFYANPQWWEKAEPVKSDLKEIKRVVNPEKSPFNAQYINECLNMCTTWEQSLDANTERNKSYADFLYDEHDHDVRSHEQKLIFKGRFHNRLMEHMLSSKAILYPKLLPKIPFRAVTLLKIEPKAGELRLIAFGLERFDREMFKTLNTLNPQKIRKPKLIDLVRRIIAEYDTFRKEKALYKIIETYKIHPKMNPIKYFFLHRKAPPIIPVMEDVDLTKLVAPKHLRRGLLPKEWDAYMFSHKRLQIYPYVPQDELEEEEPQVVIKSIIETEAEEFQETDSNDSNLAANVFKVIISCEAIPNFKLCIVPTVRSEPEVFDEILPSCIDLRSPPPKTRKKSTEEKQQNLISILKKVSDSLEKSPKPKKSVNFLLPTSLPSRSSPRFVDKTKKTKEIADTFLLTQKFFIVIESYFNKYNKQLKFHNAADPLVIRTFHWVKTIDIYTSLIKQSLKMSKKRQNDSSSSSSTDTTQKTKKSISSEEYSKKLHRKLSENRSLIMLSNRNKCTIEKDCSYSYNYLEKVKKTLTEHGDDELFAEFMTILSSFDADFESVPELYHKIEQLLMPNYSDLVDLFLTFLLPEHAVEVGKFFEHFVQTNMTSLLQKLNAFFNKQPTHMKKVLTVLNELSNEDDLTMERLKQKLIPLVKGNQLLLDWFTGMFDKPMESNGGEFETVYIKKSLSDSDNSIDNYEEIHSKDIIECPSVDELNACSVKYRNGKIMYQGILLPAKISFLAHDTPPVDSDTQYDDNMLCMHEIRKHVKFNDPKKPEETPPVTVDDDQDAYNKKFKLCDAATLHAHAVRLNSVHAQNGEKLSDLNHLLGSPGGSNDESSSPKKTKKKHSPKKNLNKSPSSTAGPSTLPSSPSKAVQTAKKLKHLIDDSNEEHSKKKAKSSDALETNKSKSAKHVDKKKTKSEKSSEGPPAKKCKTDSKSPELGSKKSENISPSTKKSEPAASSSKKSELTSSKPEAIEERGAGNWTRDEDKKILEALQVGYKSKESLLDDLVAKLSRKRSEISTRYEYLLDIVRMHNDLSSD